MLPDHVMFLAHPQVYQQLLKCHQLGCMINIQEALDVTVQMVRKDCFVFRMFWGEDKLWVTANFPEVLQSLEYMRAG